MDSLIYLRKKSFKNKFQKAIKRPITYVFLLFIVFYAVFLPVGLYKVLVQYDLDTPQGMLLLVIVFCFWMLPGNLISYTKRRGLLFKKSDIHFLFPSPLGPKMILLYVHAYSLGFSLLISLFVIVGGYFVFHLSLLQVVLFFIANVILENILESSIMILCYGSEKIKEKQKKYIVIFAYALIGCFFLIAFLIYRKYGLSIESVQIFMHSKAVQAVPLVGWYIALMHFIFVGPTAFNLICSALYLICVAVFFIWAYKMTCTGGYYEDAEKFADDYEELRAKNLQGVAGQFGKKERFRRAAVTYKGSGAKAIFYKQILEYKKSKTFFLDYTTLFLVALGNIMVYMIGTDGSENAMKKLFVLPAVMAYLLLCSSAMNGKWAKEISNPYTFLIPDSPVRKLWYATLIEHGKNLIYGILLAVPCSIILKVPALQTLLCVLLYMLMQAIKVYSLVVMEAFVGSKIGRVGKQFFHMLLQSIPMGLAVIGAIFGVLTSSVEVAYIFMSLIMVACVIVFMTIASFAFDKMETA